MKISSLKSRSVKTILFIFGFGGSSILSASDVSVTGDSPCPSGYSLVSADEARESQSELCGELGVWDIARLEGGGSMDGSGYGCKIRDSDLRGLGHALCKKPDAFTVENGDSKVNPVCTGSMKSVSSLVARAYNSAACSTFGSWVIARLSGGGSMDGPGYGCKVRDSDTRGLGHTLCATYDYTKVTGDIACPSGYALTTPEDARDRQSELCSLLGTWDIVRLAGGGSMDGSGYGCGVRDFDSRGLGGSLCSSIE